MIFFLSINDSPLQSGGESTLKEIEATSVNHTDKNISLSD
jgi:hypothetical protein